MNLDQRLGLSRQHLTLFEDKLVMRTCAIGKSTEQSVAFGDILPNPVRLKQTPWLWYAAVGISFCGSLALFIFSITDKWIGDGFRTGAVMALVPFFLAVYGAWKRTHDVIIFPSARGNIVIHSSRPTREVCKEFTAKLQERATESRDVQARTIRGVLQVLRQEDYLDEWKYAKARERFNLRDAA